MTLCLDNRGAKVLLARSCSRTGPHPNQITWDADLLDAPLGLDEQLVGEILGARRKALFVEGTPQSLDRPLYSLLFPGTKIAFTWPPSSLPTKSQFFATEYLTPEIQLADVVVQREPPVIEEAAEGDALIARVPEPGLNGRFVEHLREFGVAPLEKAIDESARFVAAYALFFFAGRVRDGPLDSKQRSDQR